MQIEAQFRKKVVESLGEFDPAHDLAHFERVVRMAKKLALQEGACMEIVVPAAWLHDLVNVPKNDVRRSQASTLSAEAATEYLKSIDYPARYLTGIFHAIQCHSFSAQISPRTLEAKVVQDADRLDALGAIGIARCFVVGGMLRRPLYELIDPFAKNRRYDDSLYTLDHFYSKLLKIGDSFQTKSGQDEAQIRVEWMKRYLTQMESEISSEDYPAKS